LAGAGGGGGAELVVAGVVVAESVGVAVEVHQRNAKLQVTVTLSSTGAVPELYLHPDHRRRLKRLPVRSDLDV
jgi:hypothetical protein